MFISERDVSETGVEFWSEELVVSLVAFESKNLGVTLEMHLIVITVYPDSLLCSVHDFSFLSRLRVSKHCSSRLHSNSMPGRYPKLGNYATNSYIVPSNITCNQATIPHQSTN